MESANCIQNRMDGKIRMKKFIIVFIMLAIIIFLTGCERAKVKDENGEYVNSTFGLIEIETKHQKQLLYDPETKVVYMYIYTSGYRAGISPYYIIGEDGKPEVAIYGVNYKEGQ